jgi:hypothetical protein
MGVGRGDGPAARSSVPTLGRRWLPGAATAALGKRWEACDAARLQPAMCNGLSESKGQRDHHDGMTFPPAVMRISPEKQQQT